MDLGCQRGEQTPWAKTVRTCRQLLQVADGLWTFLEVHRPLYVSAANGCRGSKRRWQAPVSRKPMEWMRPAPLGPDLPPQGKG